MTYPGPPHTPTAPPAAEALSQDALAVSPGASRRRWRKRAVVGIAVVALAGVLVATLTWSRPQDPVPRGNTGNLGAAPGFELEDLRDRTRTISLDDYRGRPMVVNFWASWCVPCKNEMPAFQAAYRQLRSRVAFVGINHQDTRRGALDLLAETGVRYPVGYDPDGGVARAYGLFGMPTTVVVSSKGRIVARHTGEMSRDQLLDLIKTHLSLQAD